MIDVTIINEESSVRSVGSAIAQKQRIEIPRRWGSGGVAVVYLALFRQYFRGYRTETVQNVCKDRNFHLLPTYTHRRN